jgi:hypothetical protein
LATAKERDAYLSVLMLLFDAHHLGSKEYDSVVENIQSQVSRRVCRQAQMRIKELEREGRLPTLVWIDEVNDGPDWTPGKKWDAAKPLTSVTRQQHSGAVPPVGYKFDSRLRFTDSGYCLGYEDDK